jgi:hypothetical protein
MRRARVNWVVFGTLCALSAAKNPRILFEAPQPLSVGQTQRNRTTP